MSVKASLVKKERTFIAATLDVRTVAVDPPSIAAGAKGTVDVAVTGAETDDYVIAIAPEALEAGLVPITALVTAANTVRIVLYNPTAAAIDGASRDWTIILIKTVISPKYPMPT